MLISEISVGSSEQSSEALRTLALAAFTESFPLAPFAQFYSITGNAGFSRKKDDKMTSAGANRAIGSDYTPKSNTPDYATPTLKIYGDVVKTDIAHDRRGGDVTSQRVKDLENFSRNIGRYMTNSFFNDTLSATNFSGLKEQATTLSRKSVFYSVNGGTLPSGTATADKKQQDQFFEWLDAEIEEIEGGPDVLFMNGTMKARLKTIRRNNMGTIQVADFYGKMMTVDTYGDVPIVNPKYKADATGLIIPDNETEGSNNDCTSIYPVKFGEEMDVSIATNVGIDCRDLGQVGASFQTLCEMDADVVVLNKLAFKRLSGIRAKGQ